MYDFVPYTGIDSKETCPNCHKPHHFTRFYNTETGKLLPYQYGKCDNEIKCGYVYTPFSHPPDNETEETIDVEEVKKRKDTYDTHKPIYVKKSVGRRKENLDNLSIFLRKNFQPDKVEKVLNEYRIGCSTHFNGKSTVFWQLSREREVRGGKILKYDKNGKRIKKPTPKITWVHAVINADFNLKQCFFGEHLVTKNTKRVCIVEGEKTAIICKLFYPKYIWLSTGNLNGLNEEKLKAIQDKELIVYPDKGGANIIWQEKLKKYQKSLGLSYKISNFVERKEELEEGDDLADYLLKIN